MQEQRYMRRGFLTSLVVIGIGFLILSVCTGCGSDSTTQPVSLNPEEQVDNTSLMVNRIESEYSVEGEVEIQIAPHRFLLSSDQSGEVTVHVAVAYTDVDTSSIKLNGLDVSWTKADACGDLVAKFDEAEVKAMVAPPSAILTLTGTRLDGTDFTGTDIVQIKL